MASCIKLDTVTKTDVTFYNPVFTNIYITLGDSTKTIYPGNSETFYQVTGTTASYSAYTSGATTSGTQVGLKMLWNNNISLSGGTASYNLNVSSTYFFIYVTNYGSDLLTPFYVNYGLTSQTVDNINLPNNDIKYRTGYYYAYTNTEVRAYFSSTPTYYSYWDQGTNFTLPQTMNQSVSLTNSSKKKSAIDNTNNNINNYVNAIGDLTKAVEFNFKPNSKAIDLFCK